MLGIRTWLKQAPAVCAHSDPLSGKCHSINGRLTKLFRQTVLYSLSALLIAVTLVFSGILAEEQDFKNSLVSRLSGFQQENEKEPCYFTKTHCSRGGAENLPRGIVVETSDLHLRSLKLDEKNETEEVMTKNLLAMAVGIKQKKVIDDIVQRFPLSNFTIMLFHYDGVVDQWHDLSWSNQAIHIVGLHQTKWWFAKRFMHPDVVAQYNYLFLWDEDLGVQHFHADKYLEIMEAEGMEISQPALDTASQQIHHALTRRQVSLKAHKKILRKRGMICTEESNGPPCSGFVEVMAPVFSKAAWRCVWHMIQNDLVHGWGIDFKIGYCAQGIRSEKVGVIDSEYVLHKGIPSLGGLRRDAKKKGQVKGENPVLEKRPNGQNLRRLVRKRCVKEMNAFLKRWNTAVDEDHIWKDPYKILNDSSGTYHRVR